MAAGGPTPAIVPYSAPPSNNENCARAGSQLSVPGCAPALAVTTFARRDEIGNPVMPNFLIQPHNGTGILHITQVSNHFMDFT